MAQERGNERQHGRASVAAICVCHIGSMVEPCTSRDMAGEPKTRGRSLLVSMMVVMSLQTDEDSQKSASITW